MKVIINKNDFNLIKELYVKFKNVEIGGTLIGYKVNNVYVITDVVYDNYVEKNLKKYTYKRNIENLKNKMIGCINSKVGVDYIGEWHTHPNNKSMYSQTDKNSMEKLIEDFDELLLLICGIDQISSYLFKKKGTITKLITEKGENYNEWKS